MMNENNTDSPNENESLEKDLELAAQEWTVDPVSKEKVKQFSPPETSESEVPTHFIADPYGFKTEEILKAQNDETFLLEDEEETSLELSEIEDEEEVSRIDISSFSSSLYEDSEKDGVSEKNSEENEIVNTEGKEDTQIEASTLQTAANSSDDHFNELNDEELVLPNASETESLFVKLEASLKNEIEHFENEQEEFIESYTKEEIAKIEAEAASKIAEDVALEEARLASEQASTEESEKNEIDPELLAALPKNPGINENGEPISEPDFSELESAIETLLFLSEKPMSAVKLQELLGPDFSFHYFQESLTNLKNRYTDTHHGIELVEVAGGYQFRTKANRAALAKKLARVTFQRLSSGAMETLAIIAYKQPTLKESVDEVRGVDSSHFIRTLLDRKLIKISGRSELPGRPMLYETTEDFLQVFSLNDLSELPPLSELESMVPTSQSDHDEDPRIKQMRKLVSDMKSDKSTTLLYDPKEDEQFLADIRERVKGIEVSTPTLMAEDEAKKQAKIDEKNGITSTSTTENMPGLFKEPSSSEASTDSQTL